MDKAEAIERLEYLKTKAQIALEQEVSEWIAEDALSTIEAYDMAIEALQTEPNSSEKPNNCEAECENCKHFREEVDTYMKQCEFYFMECRYEPKTEPHHSGEVTEMVEDEPQTDIHGLTDCDFCKHNSEGWGSKACDSCCESNNHFEPKTEFKDLFKGFDREALILLIENQRERIKELMAETEPQTDCKNCNNHDRCVYQPKDEPQTDCAWGESCGK